MVLNSPLSDEKRNIRVPFEMINHQKERENSKRMTFLYNNSFFYTIRYYMIYVDVFNSRLSTKTS